MYVQHLLSDKLGPGNRALLRSNGREYGLHRMVRKLVLVIWAAQQLSPICGNPKNQEEAAPFPTVAVGWVDTPSLQSLLEDGSWA